MSIRFDTQSSGVTGILFDAQDVFTGVVGDFTATLGGMAMSAVAATKGVYVDVFDVELNIIPQYLESYYLGAIGDFAATMAGMRMEANEGVLISGQFDATTGGMQMAASGEHILPVEGVFAATMGGMVMSAGAAVIGTGVTKVTMRNANSSGVVKRATQTSQVTLY
jgi:hypothetical protein